MTGPRLLDLFSDLVEQDPEATVLYDARAGQAPPTAVSRTELSATAASLAVDLEHLGLGEGDCVAVWLPNWSTAVAAQLAALSLGAHVVGVNTRYNTDEVTHVLEMARPSVVVVAHEFHGLDLSGRLKAAFASAEVTAPGVLAVTAPGAGPAADLSGHDLGGGVRAFTAAPVGRPLTTFPRQGLAVSFTTSGSTGRSKVAAHSEAGLVAHSRAVAEAAGIGPGDTVLGALPLSGVFGFTPVMAAVLAGASALLEPVFDPVGVLDDMVATRVTHAAGADDLFGRLRSAWEDHRVPLALRWVGIADFEGRSREVAAWAHDEFGTWVGGVYGSSELYALAAFWREGTPLDRAFGGGGTVLSSAIEFRVADPGTGHEVPADGEGELQFRGFNVVDAYLGDPSLSEGTFTADGWFRSGDLGRRVDEDSFVYVCRMGDVLRLQGFLVDPSEIELRLSAHPAVAVAKVVGVPSEGGATVAVGFVVPRPETPVPTSAQLRAWCADTLAKFKVPSVVLAVPEMPTTSGTNGTKIRAAALRERAADWLRAGTPS
jgi:fatty-acyl-CoA synthase